MGTALRARSGTVPGVISVDLLNSLAGQPHLPPALLDQLVRRACQRPAGDLGYRLLRGRRDLSPDQVRALLDLDPGPYPAARAVGLWWTHGETELARQVRAGELADPELLAALAVIAERADLLTALAGAALPEADAAADAGPVIAACSPACPQPAALALLDRLLPRAGTTLGRWWLSQLIRGRDGAWPAAVLEHTADPVAWELLARREDLPAAVADTLTRGWLIPAVARLRPDDRDNVMRLSQASSRLIARAGDTTATALADAWAGSPAASATPSAVLEVRLRPAAVLGAPLPALAQDWQAVAGPALATVLTAATGVCGDDPDAWGVLLRLTEGFTGTVTQLLDVTAATVEPGAGCRRPHGGHGAAHHIPTTKG